MANTKTRAVTVRLPHEVLNALNAEAEQLDMSRSEVVTRRLRKTLSAAPASSNADDAPFIPEEAE